MWFTGGNLRSHWKLALKSEWKGKERSANVHWVLSEAHANKEIRVVVMDDDDDDDDTWQDDSMGDVNKLYSI